MWPFSKSKSLQELNICIVGARFPILGKSADEGFLWPLARSLAQSGHKVSIISWQNPYHRAEISRERIHAYFLGESPRAERRNFPELALKKFLELHESEGFDIVHCLDSSGSLIAKQRKTLGVAVMFDVAATQMAQVFSILAMSQETLGSLLSTGVALAYKFLTTYFGRDRNLLSTADGVFVTTPFQKIALDRYYLYPELKTFIVPYGSEFIDLTPREKRDDLRQKLFIPVNSKNAVTVTDMTEFSEITELLHAFAKVVVKKPSSRLIIVGNGPLYKEVEFEVLTLALGSKVIFTGAVTNEDLPDYIALADVYVNLSSRTSGFEPATLEAMALEKVVVGSELSPLSTIIKDGQDGFLIRPADRASLIKILSGVLSETLPTKQIGQAARKKVIELFDANRMVEKLLIGYRGTIQSCGRSQKTRRVAPRASPDIQA
jgi:glycosyltransferase involved in cell wall biosynthesis